MTVKHGFPSTCFADLLMVYEMLHNFGEHLGVAEMPLAQLRDLLINGGFGNKAKPLLDLQLKLVKILLEDSEPDKFCGCTSEILSLRKVVNAATWPEVFRLYLDNEEGPRGQDVRRVAASLMDGNYWELSLKDRLAVLALLVNLVLETSDVREHMRGLLEQSDSALADRAQLRAKRRIELRQAQVKFQPPPSKKGGKASKQAVADAGGEAGAEAEAAAADDGGKS